MTQSSLSPSATVFNLCCDKKVSSAMLDSHADLVRALASTLKSGISGKLLCKSLTSFPRLFYI